MFLPVKWFNNLRLRQKILVLTMLAVVLTLMLITPELYFVMRSYAIESATAYSEIFTEQLQQNLSARLTMLEKQLFSQYKQLAQQAMEDTENPLKKRIGMLDAQQGLLNSFSCYRSITVVDVDGNQYFLPRDHSQPYPVDASRISALWGACLWLARDESGVCLQRMMYDSALHRAGVVSVEIDKEEISQLYQPTLEKMGGEIVILDCDDNPMLYSSQKTVDRALSLTASPQHDPAYLVTSKQLDRYGLKVIRYVSVNELMRSFQVILPILFFSCAAVLVLMCLLSSLACKGFSKNLETLMTNMKQLSHGEQYDYQPTQSQDEIGQLSVAFSQMSKQIQQLMLDVQNEQKMKMQAKYTALHSQYSALRMQINPHFLYNALDTISSMAKINRQEKISDLICTLSSLLRSSINQHDKFVPFSIELAELQNFTTLYMAMYTERISIHYEIDPKSLDVPVPSFLLQPLLENAILHGIEPSNRKGTILISAQLDRKVLKLCVADNGIGMTDPMIAFDRKSETGGKIGMASIQERLRILFGSCALLCVESKLGEGTRVLIQIPASEEHYAQVAKEMLSKGSHLD